MLMIHIILGSDPPLAIVHWILFLGFLSVSYIILLSNYNKLIKIISVPLR
jgi:hypothetical protein